MSLDLRLARWALLALAISAGTAACSGEPGDADGGGGEDGSGGTSEDGSGGSEEDGSGGESEDGSGGSEEDGSGGAPEDGSGGLGGEASGGGGSGGGSGGVPVVAEITRGFEQVLTEADDLRGLSYSSSGMLYASGYLIDDQGDDAPENDDRHTIVLRFDAEGELDESWGDFGVVELNVVPLDVEETGMGGAGPVETVINDGLEESMGVVELASGEVLVQLNLRRFGGPGSAGPTAPTRVGLLKLDEDGAVVTEFGGNGDGVAFVDFGFAGPEEGSWSDTSWGIGLDTESEPGVEKVVVFGFGTAPLASARTDNDRYVTRVLTETGARDPNFNGNAAFSYHTTDALSDGARRGIVLPGGKILSSGYTNFGTTRNNAVLIQLLADGTPDPSFGFGFNTPGVARFNPFVFDGGMAEVYAVARQSSGRLVTTGYGEATAVGGVSTLGYLSTARQDMVSFGVLPNALDPAFGNDGHMAVQSEADPPEAGLEALAAERFEERGRDVIALDDDRIVFAGRYDLRPALMIGRKNGGLDETVGDGLSGRFVYDDISADTSHFFVIARNAGGTRVASTTNYNAAAEGVLLVTLDIGD